MQPDDGRWTKGSRPLIAYCAGAPIGQVRSQLIWQLADDWRTCPSHSIRLAVCHSRARASPSLLPLLAG